MSFIFQEPALTSGATVKYDPTTHNLFTVNEQTVGAAFYQTFGDLVLNFDKLTGKLYSVDGRININNCPKVKVAEHSDLKQTCLITGTLELKNLCSDVEYGFDEARGVLSAGMIGGDREHLAYSLVLGNVVVGLNDQGVLTVVEVLLQNDNRK